MLLPGVVLVFIFAYVPMAGAIIAFKKFRPSKGIWNSEWVGWENFRYVFTLPDTMQVIWNTLYISSMKIVTGLVVPIVVAIMLNEVRKLVFKRTVQTLVYLPHFLSWVIIGSILVDMLSPSGGIVNKIIVALGGSPIYFLGSNTWFPFTLVVSNIWKEFGYGTIVYLAAITAINPTLYEAARVDGAGRFRQIWHITLPGMLPVIVLMGVLSLGNVLNAGFEQVFVLYSPAVYDSGDVLDTFVYRLGFIDMQYDVSTAVGLFKSAVSFVLICVSYWLAYRYANYRIF
jgi:putative aldouronate transport system permease protein